MRPASRAAGEGAGGSPWCMDQRGGCTAPGPRPGSRDADGLRAAELEHPVQGTSGDGHPGRPARVGARAERAPDHPLVAGDRRLGQRAAIIAGGCLPAQTAALGDEPKVAVAPGRRGRGRLARHRVLARRHDDRRLGVARGDRAVDPLCCTDRSGWRRGAGRGRRAPSHDSRMSAVPFEADAARRHRIPRQRHRVTNWADYDAALRQRGSLTVWFTDEAVAAWRAEPRTTRGGQPWYSPLAILTALTLGAVSRLGLRQTEGLIGSTPRLLGLELAVPDHTTSSRRAGTLEVPRSRSGSGGPLHLLVDSTGLKLGGPGEWLGEKHGTKTRRARRKPPPGGGGRTRRVEGGGLAGPRTDGRPPGGPLPGPGGG